MGTDDIFKKRKAARKQRKYEYRNPKANSFLIVTEGFQNVWVVFDKDDFEDFDHAIAVGQEKGYKIAWSNQSFEYWLYLHFYYSDSALHREEWNAKLNDIFQKNQLGG